MERSELPKVHRVHICSVGDQQFCHLKKKKNIFTGISQSLLGLFCHSHLCCQNCHDLKVAIAAGIVQGHQAALVLGVDVGAVGEQELDDPGSVVAGGEMQRCRLPPVAGVAVDVEWSEKGQQLLLVPTVGSMVKPTLVFVC